MQQGLCSSYYAAAIAQQADLAQPKPGEGYLQAGKRPAGFTQQPKKPKRQKEPNIDIKHAIYIYICLYKVFRIFVKYIDLLV